MQSKGSAAPIKTDLLTMQPQPSQNLIMTSNKKKKYTHQAPPPKQPHQHSQQFQIKKTFNVVSILKTSQPNPQQHQQAQSIPQSYANVVNRSIQPLICNGNMVTVNNCQINSDTAMFSINHRVNSNNVNNNIIDTNANISTGFVNSGEVGGSASSIGGGKTNIIALNNSSSHGSNTIGISIGAPTGTYSHDKNIVNVGCVDNRQYDFKNTKLITNNNFQAAHEFVPPSGANNVGNVRSNQQNANILRGHAGTVPRGSRPHIMYQQAISQNMILPPYAPYAARQPTYSTQQYSFQQPLQPNLYPPFQYYHTLPNQPHQRGVNAGPSGSLTTPSGAAQTQIQLAPVMGPVGTSSGAVMTVPSSITGQQVNMQMVNVVPQQVPPQQMQQTTRRRRHCLDIIDPVTKKNILDEVELSKNANTSDADYVDVSSPPNLQTEISMNVSQDSTMSILSGNVIDVRGSIPYNIDVHQLHRDVGTGQTPVVSAMSDGPSVEILPNPKPRTKKILPIVHPKEVEIENTIQLKVKENTEQNLPKDNANVVPVNSELDRPHDLEKTTEPVQTTNDNIQQQQTAELTDINETLQENQETVAVPTTIEIGNTNLETVQQNTTLSCDVQAASNDVVSSILNQTENPNSNDDISQSLDNMQLTEKEVTESKANCAVPSQSTTECVTNEKRVIHTEFSKSNNNNNNTVINKEYDSYNETVTCDETDRAAPRVSIAEGIMDTGGNVEDATKNIEAAVNADFDPNAETNTTLVTDAPTSLPDDTLITYKEGQWSPQNPTGKKQYAREQLLQLRDAKASRVQPNVKNHSIMPQPNLMPSFARSNNKRSGSMVGMVGSMGGNRDGNSFVNKQASMSGVHGRGSMKGDKGMIHVNLSLNQDVKLNETDNAWRPRVLVKCSEPEEDSQLKTKREKTELIRRVRGILNKLTPEKFDTLVEEIIKLKIDTTDKMEDVMVLVFEKAIDEPNFSVSYARLCQRLITEAKTRDERMESGTKKYLTHFRNALIDKTEREFTQNVSKSEAKEKKLQPLIEKIKKTTDPTEKAELTALLEEEERKIRRRSGGTVRFIGELFKISMLTGKIIQYCIDQLLQKDSEDKLECLCKLLTTVGAKYEQTQVNSKDPGTCYSLDTKIAQMQAIASKTDDLKISSRVRFMLQDVIDLRKNKWKSTRNEAPKTMEQIEKETKSEQMSSQYLNYGGSGMPGSTGSMGPGKREDRNSRYGDSRSNSGYAGSHSQRGDTSRRQGNNNNNANNGSSVHSNNNDGDTWHVQTSKGSRSQAVDTNKLEGLLNQNLDTKKMGGLQQYQQFWNRQSSSTPTTTPTNSFAVLSNYVDINKDRDRDRSGPRNKGSYNRNSMEKDRYGDRGLSSRTGSSQPSRENSSSRGGQAVRGIMNSSSIQKSASHSKYTQQMPSGRLSGKQSSGGSTYNFTNNRVDQPFASQQSQVDSLSNAYPNSPPTAVFVEPTDNDVKLFKSVISDMIEIVVSSKTISPSIVPLISEIKDNQLCGLIYYILTDYLHLVKVGQVHRRYLSNIIIYLINKKFVSIDHFKMAYQEFSIIANDLTFDIPELWLYIFEFTGPLMVAKIITINDLWIKQLQDENYGSFGQRFLKTFLLYSTREIGPSFCRGIWQTYNMKWTDFMEENKVENFIKSNAFEYIENKSVSLRIEIKEPKEKHINRVVEHVELMLQEGSNADAIIDYINGNISEADKSFIRSLTKKLCNYAITYKEKCYKLNADCFQKVCIPVLHRYIDSKEDCELECLHAMQLLVHSMEHPRGLLYELFVQLYENYVIPKDSFIKWSDSKDQSAGKGVAVKGLNPFFNHLVNGETSDENN